MHCSGGGTKVYSLDNIPNGMKKPGLIMLFSAHMLHGDILLQREVHKSQKGRELENIKWHIYFQPSKSHPDETTVGFTRGIQEPNCNVRCLNPKGRSSEAHAQLPPC